MSVSGFIKMKWLLPVDYLLAADLLEFPIAGDLSAEESPGCLVTLRLLADPGCLVTLCLLADPGCLVTLRLLADPGCLVTLCLPADPGCLVTLRLLADPGCLVPLRLPPDPRVTLRLPADPGCLVTLRLLADPGCVRALHGCMAPLLREVNAEPWLFCVSEREAPVRGGVLLLLCVPIRPGLRGPAGSEESAPRDEARSRALGSAGVQRPRYQAPGPPACSGPAALSASSGGRARITTGIRFCSG
ncbi:hypothetical protein EOD39_19400 [Acipenser ruthenus]|uniref:Uncharacterized protein n=1 Tax=Acipenser ruthenus TaxID=7906 RepID=A0A444UYA3_ACIRT|nr:hypothetical protein EOD39_19400 [Acipenser ruthenus]